ncbi:hypothetical protein Q4I30_003807 [Leishmania utingensis]|uniref:Uncharacterized protein n=1 Tax=Leishmania utingensis TaxID=653362 RepID=A0AAW3AJS0_9TRYP
MKPTATNSAAAAAVPGDDCSHYHSHHHRHDAAVPRRTDTAQHTCFYFTVFFSNKPPIFHSNRIPLEKLDVGALTSPTRARERAGQLVSEESADGLAGSALPSSSFSQCTSCQQQYWKTIFGELGADCVTRRGVGHTCASTQYAAGASAGEDRGGAVPVVEDYRSASATVEEVPQQTLQNVAFPTTFGCCGGACALPLRASGRRMRCTSAALTPMMPPPEVAVSSKVSFSKREASPLLQLPSAADTKNVRAYNAKTLMQESDCGCAQARAPELTESLSSTVETFPLSDTTTSVNDPSTSETVTWALTTSDHLKVALPSLKHKYRDTVAMCSHHNEDATATTISTAPQPHITPTIPNRAEPKALPQGSMATEAPTPAQRDGTYSAACAPAARLITSPITPVSKTLETRSATHSTPLPLAADTSTDLSTSMNDTGSAPPAASAPMQEGPPWNMKVEEVRSAKGELRYYRIILTVSFTALVTTHTGLMHSMQTRNAATALVVLCPPCGVHFRFLLNHMDVLRSVLNRTTEFAIRTVQRFFGLLYSPTQRPKGSQQQALKAIATLLEAHPEAFATYRAVKTELTNALCLRFPLPVLTPATSAWAVPVLIRSSLFSARTRSGSKGVSVKSPSGSCDARATSMSWVGSDGASASVGRMSGAGAPPSGSPRAAPLILADILHEATSFVREYSEGFASAFICGLLSLTESGFGSAGLRARSRGSNSASPTAGATTATPTLSNLTSPNVNGVSQLLNCVPSSSSPTTAHEASACFAGCGGVAAAGSRGAPEWLSPYAAYWSSLTANCSPLHIGDDDVINFGKPTSAKLEGYGRASPSSSVDHVDDGAVTTHVSTSKISPKAPSVSPLAGDVSYLASAPSGSLESHSPSPAARRTVGDLLAAPSAAAAVPPSPTRAAGSSTAPSTSKEDEYLLHRGRLGRVVIFTQDSTLARRLLVIAAFLWSGCGCGAVIGGGIAMRSGAPCRAATSGQQRVARSAAEDVALRNEEAQHMYETAVAAAVSSTEYANVPVQWVAEEFSEPRLCSLCSRFSPENTLLVVVPRQLQCRLVYLRKYVTSTTVLVEEHSGKGARICTAPFPFRCLISKQVVVRPDPTVTTLLREACSLHKNSHGTVSFTDVFQRMVGWLHWQSAAVLAREAHARAAAAATMANGAPLIRFVSTDAVWLSTEISIRSPSASSGTKDNNGSHAATPLAASAEILQTRSTNKLASSLAHRCDSSWKYESVEEALLPGSMGGAGGCSFIANVHTEAAGGEAAASAITAFRSGTTPVTSTLLVSHGLLKPPSAFTSASPTSANPTKATSFSPLKRFYRFRSSPTSTLAETTQSHPILSPVTLGQMYSSNGAVGRQMSHLLAGDDDEVDILT